MNQMTKEKDITHLRAEERVAYVLDKYGSKAIRPDVLLKESFANARSEIHIMAKGIVGGIPIKCSTWITVEDLNEEGDDARRLRLVLRDSVERQASAFMHAYEDGVRWE